MDRGPQIGDTIPPFSLPDQFGRVQTLDTVARAAGAVLAFIRSADW